MKKHIPNFITLLNLLCGCIAILFCFYHSIAYVAFFVVLGIIFDFFDGFAARLLKVQSSLGLQLDSMADMVTSGVVPGLVMFNLLQGVTGEFITFNFLEQDKVIETVNWVPLLGFCITLASGYRLANFNIDERQTSSFIGLPTPANTLFILSLGLLFNNSPELVDNLLHKSWFLLLITVLSCYMLNANIELFALKFKTWGLKENLHRYLFLITSLVLLITLGVLGIPVIIVCYVLLSLVLNLSKK